MSILVITGTGTGVGKTVVTAAIATLARAQGKRVAVMKPAQTGVADGDSGDLAEVLRLAGDVTTVELARYPDPLSPDTAARRARLPQIRHSEIVAATRRLADQHDLVLVEGAGGLLVRFDDTGSTLADVARALHAPVLVVARAGLGTLNDTALTAEALRSRGITSPGAVIGQWPAAPDLAARCNVLDLPSITRLPLLGAVAEGAGRLERDRFAEVVHGGLVAELGGGFDPAAFRAHHETQVFAG
jgi:dethiobiotin synthetase